MSPCSSAMARAPTARCRSSHVCGATRGLVHVALHTCAERHAGLFMSPFTRVRSDMRARSCRSSHVCGATCGLVHVALHTCAERHAGLFMSPLPRVRSDMRACSCRPSHGIRSGEWLRGERGTCEFVAHDEHDESAGTVQTHRASR